MTRIKPPGLATARLYVWLIILSPVALVVSGFVLLGVGIGFNQAAVAALGAAGVLAGLIIPRLTGRFEVGATGVKGDLVDTQLIRDLIDAGMEGGLTPAEAVDVAADVAEDAALGETDQWVQYVGQAASDLGSRTVPIWNEAVRRGLARDGLNEAIASEAEVERVVQAIAEERSWQFRKGVTVNVGAGSTRADFIVETNYGPLVVEFAAIKRNPRALVQRTAVLEEVMRQATAWRGILVVPDGGIHGTPSPELTIVEVSGLEAALREIPD